jgi:hypothetical protein
MKHTSIDRVRCDDMSFTKKSYDFSTENMFFSAAPCILAGMMYLGRGQNEDNFEVGPLVTVAALSNLIVFR